jgi:hypothetical protein
VAWKNRDDHAAPQARADFETPPTAPSGSQGPGYRIDDAVPKEGFLATFTVRSDYGMFTAREPGMLRQLDATSKTLPATSRHQPGVATIMLGAGRSGPIPWGRR